MITIIICGAVIYGICAIVRAVVKQSKEKARQEEIKRIQLEQAKQRAMWINARYAEQQRERQIAAVTKEQERQAEVLRKHEEQIAALECKVRKLDRDIESQNELLADYYAQLDMLLLQQTGTVTGGKEFCKLQDKIVIKNNQIRRAENRIADMRDAKAAAERAIAA